MMVSTMHISFSLLLHFTCIFSLLPYENQYVAADSTTEPIHEQIEDADPFDTENIADLMNLAITQLKMEHDLAIAEKTLQTRC